MLTKVGFGVPVKRERSCAMPRRSIGRIQEGGREQARAVSSVECAIVRLCVAAVVSDGLAGQ